MASEIKPGGSVRVTINKTVGRAAARKTLERLFMKDRTITDPLDARSKNFKEIPKRRGGCIWTKRTNKLHCDLTKGVSALVPATAQHLRDLNSVSEFVEVKKG